MDDRAHDTEQEITTDLKKFRTGRCSKCVTKRWPQVFSSIVAETGCLAVKAAGFLERESKHFFLVILFLVLHSLSLFLPLCLSSPQIIFQFYCQNSLISWSHSWALNIFDAEVLLLLLFENISFKKKLVCPSVKKQTNLLEK